MSLYRSPPLVLPSQRDHHAEVKAEANALDPFDRWTLHAEPSGKLRVFFPAFSAAIDDALRTDAALLKAEAAPVPAFASGPPLGRWNPPPPPKGPDAFRFGPRLP